MSEKLVTRCPRCRTVFMVRPEQLAVRKGVVRCGRCDTVFRARTRPMAATPAPARRGATRDAAGTTTAESGIEVAAEAATDSTVGVATPTRAHLSSSLLWLIGLIVLTIATLAQVLRIGAPTLVVWVPFAQPWLAQACIPLGCEARLPLDLRRLDLVSASVAVDARSAHKLRVEATLVNRATHLQGWPVLELSLSDTHGAILARRAYAPSEYLGNQGMLDSGPPPGIAVPIEFAIERPGADPDSYELRLIQQTESPGG
jgi:predicted Zn finger-like uncharacterized protein